MVDRLIAPKNNFIEYAVVPELANRRGLISLGFFSLIGSNPIDGTITGNVLYFTNITSNNKK